VISVIVVVYEQAAILRAALQCLSEQTYQGPLEVIVCDDGSRSDLAAVVKAAVPRLRADLKYIWHPHRGYRVSAARNNGIRAARGDLLVFLDGDMLVPPDFLERHRACHDRERTLVCGTRRTYEIARRDRVTLDLIRRCGRPCAPNEAEEQLRWAATPESWMALISANFSAPRAPEILFDEHFQGWGSEDRELAYRLVIRHQFRLVATAAVEAVHVRWASNAQIYDPFITGDEQALVEFLANKLYLRDLYPDADLSPMFRLLTRCYLDPERDRWQVGPPGSTPDAERVIAQAREWFARRKGRTDVTTHSRSGGRRRDGARRGPEPGAVRFRGNPD
jgi:glycosyltransferase involved in cell wall biosynthesis